MYPHPKRILERDQWPGYGEDVIINGRKRKGFYKYGVLWVQEGFACRLETICKLEKIVRPTKTTKDKLYNDLCEAFCRCYGLGEDVRQPGILYDSQNVRRRIVEAVERVKQGL